MNKLALAAYLNDRLSKLAANEGNNLPHPDAVQENAIIVNNPGAANNRERQERQAPAAPAGNAPAVQPGGAPVVEAPKPQNNPPQPNNAAAVAPQQREPDTGVNLTTQVPISPGVFSLQRLFSRIPDVAWLAEPQAVREIQYLLPAARTYAELADSIRNSPHLTRGQRASALIRLNNTGLASANNRIYSIVSQIERDYAAGALYRLYANQFGIMGAARMLHAVGLGVTRSAWAAGKYGTVEKQIANGQLPANLDDRDDPNYVWYRSASRLESSAVWFNTNVTPSRASLVRWLTDYIITKNYADNDPTKMVELYIGHVPIRQIITYAKQYPDEKIRELAKHVEILQQKSYGEFRTLLVREAIATEAAYEHFKSTKDDNVKRNLLASMAQHIVALAGVDRNLLRLLHPEVRQFIQTNKDALINATTVIDTDEGSKRAIKEMTATVLQNLPDISQEPSITSHGLDSIRRSIQKLNYVYDSINMINSKLIPFDQKQSMIRSLWTQALRAGILEDIANVLPLMDYPEFNRNAVPKDVNNPITKALDAVKMAFTGEGAAETTLTSIVFQMQETAPYVDRSLVPIAQQLQSTIDDFRRRFDARQRIPVDKLNLPNKLLTYVRSFIPSMPDITKMPDISPLLTEAAPRGPYGPIETLTTSNIIGKEMNYFDWSENTSLPMPEFAKSDYLRNIDYQTYKKLFPNPNPEIEQQIQQQIEDILNQPMPTDKGKAK